MKKKSQKTGIKILSTAAAAAVALSHAQCISAEEILTSSQSNILINEIESDDPSGGNDWIEIINAGTTDVDISGWFVVDNDGLTRKTEGKTWGLADGTILKAGEILVLEDSINFDFGLGKNDSAILYDKDNNLIDSYTWTSHANGTWSRIPGGNEFTDAEPTKGISNILPSNPDPNPGDTTNMLVINEINSAPDDWVEIMNTGISDLDISGYEIRDNSNDHRWKMPEGTVIKAGELFLINANTLGKIYDDKSNTYVDGEFQEAIGIGSGDSIRLYDKEGLLLDSYSWTEHASYNGSQAAASYGRYPDGTGSFTLMPETPGEKNNWYKPEIVINEVESNDDVTDWVEVYNAGQNNIDISGWYILDNDPIGHKTDVTPLPEGTILKSGEYFVFDGNKQFSFGLGKADKATLFNRDGEIIDEYEWSVHANGVYARIPDGTGEFQDIPVSTKGKSNTDTGSDKPIEDNAIDWPGTGDIVVCDNEPMFLEDSSGLDFHDGKLYAVDNGTGKFWIMDVAADGSVKFANGFENGKRIRFQKDAGNSKAAGPDSEGITVDNDGFVYVACERDNSAKGVNYNTILKVNPNLPENDLVATCEWDLTASLPQVAANTGLEAVEWVSNAEVSGKLFDQNTKAPFNISNYPKAISNGVFFVALEDNGHVYAYVLNNDNSFVQIADLDSTIGGAMALDYDEYEHILWVAADNGFGNKSAQITFTGKEAVKIQLVKPQNGLDITKNYEGFAIADASYTVNGSRPVYHFEDGVSRASLVRGSLNCDYKPENEKNELIDISLKTSNVSVSGIKSYKYNGKAITQPDMKIMANGETLKPNTDYSLKYSNNINAGTATVTITGKGKYTGSISKTFKIVIKKGSIYTVKNITYKVLSNKTNGKGTVSVIGCKYKKSNKNFKTLKIGNTVTIGGIKYKITRIARASFKDYKYLRSVTLGSNISYIGPLSFYGCQRLSNITFSSANIRYLGKRAFKNIKNSANITLPKISYTKYKKLLKNSYISSKIIFKRN